VRQSFFLQLAFLGALRYPEGNPIECDRQVYRAARAALAAVDVRFLHRDIFDAACKDDPPFDFVSLSDVPSFLPDVAAGAFLQRLKRQLSPNALVVSRGHLRVIKPADDGFENVSSSYASLFAEETTQLWTIQVHRLRS
jgi:S-adenosylmethionine-diacylglycerol 3-amino-3-carboxypropyl transferase